MILCADLALENIRHWDLDTDFTSISSKFCHDGKLDADKSDA